MPRLSVAVACLCLFAPAPAADAPPRDLAADPPTLALDGPNARFTLLVSGRAADGRVIDFTPDAAFSSDDPAVAAVAAGGRVRAVRDGSTTIRATVGGKTVTVRTTVTGSALPRGFHFETDIEPLFGRFGCNSSGCHGKAEGQNGFKLSVFGFDPESDLAALAKDGKGRHVFPAAPAQSLLLTKASGQVPHGGGTKIPAGSDAYETLRGWVAAGCPVGAADAPRLASIRVEPAERVMTFQGRQQLRVIGRFSDGREVDVTANARFQSNRDAVAAVTADGLVAAAADVPGEAAVMAAYLNEVAVFRALVPQPGEPVAIARPPSNFIDPLVDARLQKLNIAPSGPAADAEFLRRVSLDIVGTLPTAAEARAFLADPAPDKRAKLIDRLLERPEYADLWALKWADLLRVERGTLGHKRAYAYYQWIRQAVAANKPLDQFAREVVRAEGPLDEVGPANFYKVVTKPGEMATTLSQVFLGVRITCAECHHHPFDRWGQQDYAGMAGFFTPVGVKKIGAVEATVAAGLYGSKHPRTGKAVPPTPLGAEAVDAAPDPRERLAAWLTDPGNPFFARNIANRTWAAFFGAGLVDPVDDVRATNPPTNPELLDALAKHLIDSKFDAKALVRAIANSRTYQTSSAPTAGNAKDDRNASRAVFRPVPAEVLCDMLSQVTGVPAEFGGVPSGTRAIQLWDSKVPSYLLRAFGRPVRMTACECGRVSEPTLAAVLHVLNGEELTNQIRHDGGAVARWAKDVPDDQLAEELTLTFFARPPTDKERSTVARHLAANKSSRRRAVEDLVWALVNTREFLQNH